MVDDERRMKEQILLSSPPHRLEPLLRSDPEAEEKLELGMTGDLNCIR